MPAPAVPASPAPGAVPGAAADPTPGPPLSGRERVALVLVAAAPVAFVPGALDRFVFAKVAATSLAASLAAFGARRGRLPPVVVALLAAGAVVLLVDALDSASPLGAVLGRAPRYEGVLVLPVYVAAAAAGARLLGPRRRRAALPWWLRALAVAAVAVAVVAALEALGLRPLSSDVARPGSLLGNASDEGAFGVLVLGPLGAVAARVRDRWCTVGAIAALAVVALSASRGALVGAVVVAVVLVVVGSSRPVRLTVVAGLAVLAVAALALPVTRGRILGTSPLAVGTVHGRDLLWHETAGLVGDHLATGVGPSGFVDAIPARHDRTWELDVGSATPVDSPHDWLLQAAADGGVPLAVLAVAMVVVVAVLARRRLRAPPSPGEGAAAAGMVAGLAGYATALLFHFTSPGTTPLAAFMVGVVVAVPSAPSAPSAPSVPSVPSVRSGVGGAAGRVVAVTTGALLAGLTVVLLAAGLAEIPLRSAVVDVAAGRYGPARSAFRLAHDLRPWDPEIGAATAHAWVVAAQRDARDGSTPTGRPGPSALAEAGPAAGAELTHYPDSLQAVEDVATVDLLEGRPAAAARLLRRAATLAPDDARVLLLSGVAALDGRQWAEAVTDLRRGASLDPSDPTPWLDLATAYRAEGRPGPARAATAQARRRSRT